MCHIPQNGVMNGCESPCSCWESNLGPLGEQSVLLSKLSLQPCECHLFLSPKLLWSHNPPFTPYFDFLWIWFAKVLFRISSPCPPQMGLTFYLLITFISLKISIAHVCTCMHGSVHMCASSHSQVLFLRCLPPCLEIGFLTGALGLKFRVGWLVGKS